jgi:hypothetical protein
VWINKSAKNVVQAPAAMRAIEAKKEIFSSIFFGDKEIF